MGKFLNSSVVDTPRPWQQVKPAQPDVNRCHPGLVKSNPRPLNRVKFSSPQANAIKRKKCNVLTYSLNTWRHLTPIQCMARCSLDSHKTPTFTWFYSRDSSKVQTPIYEKFTLGDAVSTKLDMKRSIMDPAAGLRCMLHVRMATTMLMANGTLTLIVMLSLSLTLD